MDQKTFDELSAQGKINIVSDVINSTTFRIMTPAEQNPSTFDCHYIIPDNPQLNRLEVLSNSKSPFFIEKAEMLFSLTSLSKALGVLYDNRDLMGVAVPCNVKITIKDNPKLALFDVNFFVSLQDVEMTVKEQKTVQTVPNGMLTFQTEQGEQYFINVQLPALYASLTEVAK